jgi:hypothetical protein
VLATAAAVGAFGLVLLAAPCYAQTVPTAVAEASVSSLLPTKPRAAAEADANRPFRKEATMKTTMTPLNKESTMKTTMTPLDTMPSTATPAVRPFHISVPEEALVALRQRLAATRWPDKETVTDQSQGVQLATMQDLVRYWQTDYDWRKAEAKLNDLPQFVTTIDGVDIYFIHVRSRYPNALPLIMTHGWPGSIFELLKVIGPLTDPPTYGRRPEDAFDLVLPSMPGYGFSGKQQVTGWNPDYIARALDQLMKCLGYTYYVL